jgi:secreted PhoX family phosphatase
MDRPEDVQPNAMTGKVYCMLTNNTRRKEGDENAANPRANNAFGHIIEITETDGDFASTRSTWEILLKCGDPSSLKWARASHPRQPRTAGSACPTTAPSTPMAGSGCPPTAIRPKRPVVPMVCGRSTPKGSPRHIQAVLPGSGRRRDVRPAVRPQGETVFLAVQHPGDEGLATFEQPATRWPDFRDDMPVRPSVVAVTKQGGGKIGMA